MYVRVCVFAQPSAITGLLYSVNLPEPHCQRVTKPATTTTIEVAHKWTPVNPRKECPITQLQLIFNLFFLCFISHSYASVGLVFSFY